MTTRTLSLVVTATLLIAGAIHAQMALLRGIARIQ